MRLLFCVWAKEMRAVEKLEAPQGKSCHHPWSFCSTEELGCFNRHAVGHMHPTDSRSQSLWGNW